MQAYTYVEKGKFALLEKPKPVLLHERDAIVKVTLASICSSDLHIKHGSVPRAVPGITVGHEMVGVVESVGSAVTHVKPGDRVTVNVETFCGECFFCKKGFVNNCTDENGGWALGCRIDGGQTEYVRVPFADQGLNKIPDGVTDRQALLVGDVLATGFWAARISEITAEDTVLILGAGPTGICTLLCVMLKQPKRIIVCEKDESRVHFINKNQRQRSGGKDEKRMSITINKNGRTFIVECIIFQDASFEISINDVTQEEEQINLKRQLTQNIAHELKTPVSSIQGYLETIVSNENIPREKINVFLERCYAQSNRLSRLLRDISVLTRMDEAANMIDMERVDISLLVGNIINEVALELDEKHITVVNSLKKSIQIKGNYSLIYSIFRNLMDNAIAYAGTNIQININCFREDEGFYYFSFADTGVGVSPEHLNRLFERFYRVDKGRSRKLGGTGLGLAIVKNAVIIHGGSISAKNNQGGGLEFVFTLAKER